MTVSIGRRCVYLAGPDVFRRDSRDHGMTLVEICARHGLAGLYPGDDEIIEQIAAMKTSSGCDIAEMIFQADIAKIRQCEAVIANLQPFRGPSADPGTTWEMGMAYGMGKPVFAYCDDQRPHHEKTRDWNGAAFVSRDGIAWAKDEMMVDHLGEIDNLMMTRSVIGPVAADFETAVVAVRQYFIEH